MNEGGANSPWGGIPGLLEDHVELLDLECRYESEVGRRRLLSLALAALCFVSSFLFIQIAIVYGVWRLGVPLDVISLGLAILWGIVGVAIYQRFGRRDRTAESPFKGTREEFRRSFQWMCKRLF